MDIALETYARDLKELRKAVRSLTSERVSKGALRSEAERLGRQWFDLQPQLEATRLFSSEALKRYADASSRLIKVSAPNNWATSYTQVLDTLIKPIRDELILPLKSYKPSTESSAFDAFVTSLKDPQEGLYFEEAVQCARHGFLRAAAVMAWCSAIDRIHRKIESIGFTTFNVTSAHMASQQKGRFKKFGSSQSVTSISELREVPDTIILWIVEGMHLIDSNQHTRLRSCFDMRNHSAHPGEAPITEFNLMSLFSDIDQIVLNNQKFEI